MYQGYQNRLHHERLARCPLSHEWAVLVADECHKTLKQEVHAMSVVYTSISMVYTWYIHDIY